MQARGARGEGRGSGNHKRGLRALANLSSAMHRGSRHFSLLMVATALAACSSVSTRPAKPGGYYLDDGPGANPPANLEQIADAVPVREAVNRSTSRPYAVLGKTYTPFAQLQPYRARGRASWYGKRYHGQKTSNGEVYDMYAMSAAHPLLPLPCYVRVTNVENGKSVVVRVNDRGPFHDDRIIDLSYTAAYKLGFVAQGSAMVEIETILPGESQPVVASRPIDTAQPADAAQPVDASKPIDATAPVEATQEVAALKEAENEAPVARPLPVASATVPAPAADDLGGFYLQLGAFAQADNAESFLRRARADLPWLGSLLGVQRAGTLTKVQAGPYVSRQAAENDAQRVRQALGLTPFVVIR
jgi:rare lipoprotein A